MQPQIILNKQSLLQIGSELFKIHIRNTLLRIVKQFKALMYTTSSFKAELNNRGWRMTPQRQTILDVFQNLPDGRHLSAEDLHTRLHNEGENISLATIYRTLKLMSRMGILRELELAEGHKHYELNQPAPHHHHHLICVRCNKTIEFRNDSVLRSGVKVADKHGYHLLDCQLTIHAVCPACQRSLIPL